MKNIDFPRSGVGPPNFQLLPLIFLEPPLRHFHFHFHAADEIPQKLKSCQHLEFVKLNEPELSNLFGVHQDGKKLMLILTIQILMVNVMKS